MAKIPKLMDLLHLRRILEPHMQEIRANLFMDNELAILYGNARVLQLLVSQKPPFSIDDHRLGIIVRGEIRAHINLVEKHLTAGTVVFIGPGSILHPISFSPDFEIIGIGLSVNFPMPFPSGQMPPSLNGQVRDFQLHVEEHDIVTARHIIDTLWHVVHSQGYNRQTVQSLVAAQMYHYDGLYNRYAPQMRGAMTREQTIFDRFIYLVNQHSVREHHLEYYARRLCLTEHYLGTVVKEASGTTAKGWIDRALITRIKVELRHTDKPVGVIADEMHFPSAAFFCKYFKRLAGMTPAEFRRG